VRGIGGGHTPQPVVDGKGGQWHEPTPPSKCPLRGSDEGEGGFAALPFFHYNFCNRRIAVVYFEKSRYFVNRHGFTFPHEGKELAGLADYLYIEFRDKELAARLIASDLLRDAQVHHEDRRVIAAKDDIVKYGKLREQCAVWAHEFERKPEREFSLGIADVWFFRIFGVEGDAAPYESTTNRNGWKFAYYGDALIEPLLAKCLEVKASMADMKDEEKHEAEEEMQEVLLLAEEFKKNPDKEVNLALGDVVYFNLAPLLKRTEEE